MARGLALLLALALGPLRPGLGQPLRVEPAEPVVALGASQQLTCHLACARGAGSVRWRGLDTSLGAMQAGANSSVLWVHNASLAAAGTRVCVGACGDQTLQLAVQLRVYAFPDRLSVRPAALELGRRQEVACTAHGVTPAGPEALSFSLLLEGQELAGAQALGREQEEEAAPEAEDPLFRVTQRWLLPASDTPTPGSLLCRATMRLPGLALARERRFRPVLHSQTSPEPPDPTSLPTSAQLGSTHGPGVPRSPGPCRPEILQASESGRETSRELLCQASCGPGTAVRWTLAPGGLQAYERKEAGTRAWLSVRLPPSGPGGWFQCRVEPGGQVASLYVPSPKPTPKASPAPEAVLVPGALWAGSLALGLLLVIPTYRLWKRFRPAARDTEGSSAAPV